MFIQLIRVCDLATQTLFGYVVRRMDGDTVVKAVWIPGEQVGMYSMLEKVQRLDSEEVQLSLLEIPLAVVQD